MGQDSTVLLLSCCNVACPGTDCRATRSGYASVRCTTHRAAGSPGLLAWPPALRHSAAEWLAPLPHTAAQSPHCRTLLSRHHSRQTGSLLKQWTLTKSTKATAPARPREQRPLPRSAQAGTSQLSPRGTWKIESWRLTWLSEDLRKRGASRPFRFQQQARPPPR